MQPAARKLDRSGYELDFDSGFESATLNDDQWLPYYLPQWSGREHSRARYDFDDGRLTLRIDEDQDPWGPEFDGDVKVSSLQTGVFSGSVGSTIGQHRFGENVVVRESQQTRRLYTPHLGLIEARARALDDPRSMVALWMIGFEQSPEESGELCVFEIFGNEVGGATALVGMGLHSHHDPSLVEDFDKVRLDLDVREPHTYSAEWLVDRVRFFVDDALVHEVGSSPRYAMQLMLGIYEFPSTEQNNRQQPSAYPKSFSVDWVRGWSPASAAST